MVGSKCSLRGASLALLAAGLLCALPHAAAGESGLRETAAGDAKRRLVKGRDALDGMRYAEAISLLGEALEFFREADLTLHRAALAETQGLLAAAHLFADDEAEARNTLRALFTVDPTWDLPVERRSPKLGALIDTVRAELSALQRAPLEVRSSPEGARVILDGLELGLTPLTTAPLLPGRHVLALEREGALPRQEVIFVGPDTKLDWVLEAQPEPEPEAPGPQAPVAAAPVTAPRRPGFLRRHRAELLLGTAGVSVASSVLLLWQAQTLADDAAFIPQPDTADYDRQIGRARNLNRSGNALIYVSAAAGLLGAYYLFSDGADEPGLRAAALPLPGGGALTFGGTF
ncbi:MAG: PEGA domain-containing protein [Deltaproteobacteria bacterium]|nr:PEGA domain-containing protein [Deltaproteobacteria bacterium]